MKIKLNEIEFNVTSVAGPEREVLVADPILARGVKRDLWSWDQATGKGEWLSAQAGNNAVALPNGILFHVPKAGGAFVLKAEGPSRKMTERFLEVVGAKSLNDVMLALTRIVGQLRHPVPLSTFAPLNPAASYVINMETEFAVLRMENAARNLLAYLAIPARITFGARIGPIADEAAHAATIAAEPKLVGTRPGFVLGAPTEAALLLRRIALAQRMTDLTASLGGVDPANLPEGDPRRVDAALLTLEFRSLQPKKAA